MQTPINHACEKLAARVRIEPLERRQLLAAGDLDASFSLDGLTTRDIFGDTDRAYAVAVLPSGKVIVAGDADTDGESYEYFADVALVRFNTDGSLDETFGVGGADGDGVATYDVVGFGADDHVKCILLQPDGKILVGGRTKSAGNTIGFVSRFNANGTPDSPFGSNGTRLVDFGVAAANINDLALQPNGKIVFAGDVRTDIDEVRAGIGRLDSLGGFDSEFSDTGYAYYDTGAMGSLDGAAGGKAIAIQDDGRILLGGTGDGDPTTTECDMFVFRFERTGLLDNDFADGGKAFVDIAKGAVQKDDILSDVISLPNGNIVLAGLGAGAGAVAMLDGDGKVTRKNTVEGFGGLYFENIARQADNSIVAVGSDAGLAYLVRFASNLELDGSFNNDGLAPVAFGDDVSLVPHQIALAPDGRIVLAGGALAENAENDQFEMAIARVLAFDDDAASISGKVYVDRNANGIKNKKDKGISGTRVFLDLDKDKKFDAAVEPSVLSLSNGRYTFPGLDAGTYRVREIVPPRFKRITPTNPASHKVVLSEAQNAKGFHFFNQSRAILTGTVWEDVNFDFEFDDDELGLEGFVVFIDQNTDGIRQNDEIFDTTDVNGRWEFKGLNAGFYTVRVELKDDYTATVGPDRAAELAAGGIESDLDMGLRQLDV